MLFGDTSGRIAGPILGGLGLILLVAAATTALQTRKFLRTVQRAEGVVTALNSGGSHPQIGFQPAAGEFVSYPQGGFIFGFRPGDKVQVLYNPADPRGTAVIDSWGAVWFGTFILAGIGVILFIAGAWSLTKRL